MGKGVKLGAAHNRLNLITQNRNVASFFGKYRQRIQTQETTLADDITLLVELANGNVIGVHRPMHTRQGAGGGKTQ